MNGSRLSNQMTFENEKYMNQHNDFDVLGVMC